MKKLRPCAPNQLNTQNPIKYLRNPNSPAAIQARLNGLPDPEPVQAIQLINDTTASRIFIDLTDTDVHQRVGYIVTGGGFHTNKRLVSNSLSTDAQGRLVMTTYYINTAEPSDTSKRHGGGPQWIIIKGYYTRPLPADILAGADYSQNFPKSTIYGGYGEPGMSARGENWRNEGRSVDQIHRDQYRDRYNVKIDPHSNNNILNPEDDYAIDFDGNNNPD